MCMIRLAWKSKVTSASGGGHWREDTKSRQLILEGLVSMQNRDHPELHHWIEKWTRRGN